MLLMTDWDVVTSVYGVLVLQRLRMRKRIESLCGKIEYRYITNMKFIYFHNRIMFIYAVNSIIIYL